MAQNVLAETQAAILPLVPYLDTLRWVFHRRCAWWDRGHDLRPARGLAQGAAMMTALLGGIAASPLARVALRYGAIALAEFVRPRMPVDLRPHRFGLIPARLRRHDYGLDDIFALASPLYEWFTSRLRH